MTKQTNQFTFNIKESNSIWKKWCEDNNLIPMVEYKKSNQEFLFRFSEGKFEGLTGRAYWASIKRGSKPLLSALTKESKQRYFKELGLSKGLDIQEEYKDNRKVKHRFIAIEGKYKGCEGHITLNELECIKSIDTRSLTTKGKKQYFDSHAERRNCKILQYPDNYRIKTKDRIIVLDSEGMKHSIIVQDFFDKSSKLEVSYLSEGEKLVKEALLKNNIPFVKEKSIYTEHGRRQRFDFYFILEDTEYAIEYNGAQHYRDSSGYFSNSTSLEHIQYLDKLKEDYCKRNNINLLVIPYTIKTVEDIEKEILKFISKPD